MHNRISRLARFSFPAPVGQVHAASAQSTMIAVPVALRTPWQAHVYRLAYEKALRDTAPPRHMTRFFSVWN